MRTARDVLGGVLAEWLPPACIACHSALLDPREFLCADCRGELEIVEWPTCPCTNREFDPAARAACEFCRSLPRDCFATARAAFPYRGVVGDMIRALKYKRGAHAAPAIASLALARIGRWVDELRDEHGVDCVAAVPMHWSRRIRRGGNHAEYLAAEFARLARLDHLSHTVRRVRRTPQQTRRKHKDRLANVEGAFLVVEPAALSGRRVLLVDDVMTTGATMSSCAQALRLGGADAVHLLSPAFAGRAPVNHAPPEMSGTG